MIAFILVIAAGLRALYFVQYARSPYFEPMLLDSGFYHEWAGRWAEGQWIGSEAFYGLPLYPFFLSVIYRVFPSGFEAAKAIQLLLGVFHVLLIRRLTLHFWPQRKAVADTAALLAAVYAPFIFHEPMYIPEALGMSLYTAVFYLSLKLWQKQTRVLAFAFALSVAWASLTKPGVLVYAVLYLALLLTVKRRPQRSVWPLVALAGLVFTAVYSPVWVHNWKASGDRVFATWHGGFNFYVGNHPGANGFYATPPGIGTNIQNQKFDSRRFAVLAEGRELKPSEVSAYWSRKAWEFIVQNPKEFLKLYAYKWLLFVYGGEISDIEDIRFSRRFIPVLAFLPLGFTGIWVLAAWGLSSAWGSLSVSDRRLWALWLLTYTASVALFFVNARYRLPMVSALMPIAAYGIHEMMRVFRGPKTRSHAWGLVLALAAWGASQVSAAAPDFSVQSANVGNIYLKKNDVKRAIPFFEEAVRANPRYAKGYTDWGVALQKQGQWTEAVEKYQKALSLNPADAYAHNNLGLAWDHLGRFTQAEAEFRKAVELKPDLAEAYNNLGMTVARRGRLEEAEKLFELSLKIHPASPRAWTNLGLVYHYLKRPDPARACWKKALELDPNFVDARRALAGELGPVS